MPVVGVAGDEAMFGPSGDGVLVDIETRGRFLFCQHSTLPQAVIARAQLVLVSEIGNSQGREAGVVATAACGLARTVSLLVEQFCDLGIDVVVEEVIDQFDDAGLRLDLLGGRFWAQGGERLDLAAFESHVNLGGSFRRQLDESDILDDVGKQSLAFAVWCIGIRPELVEIHRHCDQPLADSFIKDELIVLPGTLALFAGLGQNTELLVPFAFERVGDETIIGIDQHETALGEIGLDLGALDRAAAQPICFFMPGLDLLTDFERQFDGGRRHLLGNQPADGFIDRRPGDRLAQGFPTIRMGAIADVPGFLSAAPGSVANPEMPAALPTHGPTLQQRRAFSWD